MTDLSPIEAIKSNVVIWNQWRKQHPDTKLSFAGMDLRNINMNTWQDGQSISNEGANLRNIDFSETDLSNSYLAGADLSYSIFRNATIINAEFRRAICEHSDFSNAKLLRSRFHKANVNYANFSGADLAKTDFSVNYAKALKLTNTNLKDIELEDPGLELIIPVPLADPYALLEAESLQDVNADSQKIVYDYIKRCANVLHSVKTNRPEIIGEGFEETLQKANALLSIYKEENPPQSLITTISQINLELVKYLKQHPHHLHQIHWRTFEELVAELLASFGWEVELTSPTKDNGYDIFAVYRDDSGIRHNWIVECKKYDIENKIGIDIVRSLYGVKTDLKVGNALLATTSFFTKGVEDFKLSHYDFDTKDFNAIIQWLNQYKLSSTNKLYISDNKLHKGLS